LNSLAHFTIAWTWDVEEGYTIALQTISSWSTTWYAS
jgi:hypothetical protein